MKTLILYWSKVLCIIILTTLLLFTYACNGDSFIQGESQVNGSNYGTYTFWVRSDLGVGKINVVVDNLSVGTVINYNSGGIVCGSGDVNVVKKAGTYNWSARSTNGTIWSGSITFTDGVCQKMELTN